MRSTCALWPIRNRRKRGGTIDRIRIAHSPLAASNVWPLTSAKHFRFVLDVVISKIRAGIYLCPSDVRRTTAWLNISLFPYFCSALSHICTEKAVSAIFFLWVVNICVYFFAIYSKCTYCALFWPEIYM